MQWVVYGGDNGEMLMRKAGVSSLFALDSRLKMAFIKTILNLTHSLVKFFFKNFQSGIYRIQAAWNEKRIGQKCGFL